jgi:hypothetical protein
MIKAPRIFPEFTYYVNKPIVDYSGKTVRIKACLKEGESSIEKEVEVTFPESDKAPEPAPKTVKLTAGRPIKVGDNFQSNVVAQVLEGSQAKENVSICLIFEGNEIKREVSDASGMIKHELDIPASYAGQTVSLRACLTDPADAATDDETSLTVPPLPSPTPKIKSIKLNAGNPARVGADFQCNVVAQAIEGDKPIKNVPIQLLFDGADLGCTSSDTSGTIKHQLNIPARFAGQPVTLIARLTDDDANVEKDVIIPVPTITPPATPVLPQACKIDFKAHGKDGSYCIIGQVLNEEGKGEKFRVVFAEECCENDSILPPGSVAGKWIETTNEQGLLALDLQLFHNKRRYINIQIEGSPLTQRLSLDGPKQPFFKGSLQTGEGFLGNLFQDEN